MFALRVAAMANALAVKAGEARKIMAEFARLEPRYTHFDDA